jgi:hypothetical protein
VNGNQIGQGKFFGGVKAEESLTIQILRDGWQPDEKQFTLESLKSREGIIDYQLKPSEARGQGSFEVKEPNGGDIKVFSDSGEIIHHGRIDRDELTLSLPEGRYRVLRSDQATGQSTEDLITIVRDVRAQLSPWR